jgi:hypothetical protein
VVAAWQKPAGGENKQGGIVSVHVRRQRKTILAVVGLVIIGLVPLLASPASADNFGSSGKPGTGNNSKGEPLNGVWFTKDFRWSVARMKLTATYSAGVEQAVEEEFNRSDLDGFVHNPIQCTEMPQTPSDVCVFDDDYGGNGLWGWNACAGTTSGSHPNQRCSLAWVRINLRYSPAAKAIACHELGHSVGLRHTSDQASCMKDPPTSSRLTSHDIAHLNSTY